MPFRCPQCEVQTSLVVAASIDLPPDSRSDEISLQVVSCSACKFRGLAVYEESRRGALGSESWNHTGYRVDLDVVEAVLASIRSCPNPNNARCRCKTHADLRRVDERGVWRGLAEMDGCDTFAMRFFAR